MYKDIVPSQDECTIEKLILEVPEDLQVLLILGSSGTSNKVKNTSLTGIFNFVLITCYLPVFS